MSGEELLCLYRSPNIVRATKSRRLRWAEHIARLEEGMITFNISTRNPTENIFLGKPGHRNYDLRGTVVKTRNWIDSAPIRDYWRALENAA